jgi:putative heme-binding domain-containing protein
MTRAGVLVVVVFAIAAFAQDKPVVSESAKGAKGLESALAGLRAPTRDTPPLSPQESLNRLRIRPGYVVELIATEPVVRQPLNISFDARGRMWVMNYAQYPFPKGLKIVEYDRYIRAKFDKVPPPPPRAERGADWVSIHEDADGDGAFESVKTFVDGLNIATSALPGKGGVWVMNPPYLLFYPDADGDDRPDGDPVVHLSGFGLEDTHAVASSLVWGPDGWIYGAHGSTCTAKVKVEVSSEQKGTTDFLGQAIWRYHPERHVFEIFAEGGGNTFGVAFDDKGRCFSGTNWGDLRGVDYVQGGYYIKSWGKHGPLTNPNTFGFFGHMPHSGDGKRLTHTFNVYGGALMPELRGKIVGPNPLMSRVQVTRLEAVGSSFRTIEEEPLVVSEDGWFRPVDLKVGPDGAIYVADFYENRISHVDPRDNWDRSNGRLWRIRPANWKPTKALDWSRAPTEQLVAVLRSEDRTARWTARRMIAERGDRAVIARLREMLAAHDSQSALEALWAIHGLGAFDDAVALEGLGHTDPHVRMWAVRLLGDPREHLATPVLEKIVALARDERHPEVRSQLASTAKRLPDAQGVAVARELLRGGPAEDARDAHIPLLAWWAVEAHLPAQQRDEVVGWFADRELWQSPVARDVVAPRVARWLVSAGGPEGQRSLVRLIDSAPGEPERKLLYGGIGEGLQGRVAVALSPELSAALARSGDVELAARAGDRASIASLIRSIGDDDPKLKDQRTRRIELLGQVGPPEAAQPLLDVALASKWHSVRKAALAALVRFNDPEIGRDVVANYAKLPADQGVRPAAISTLLARKTWSLELLRAIEAGVIPKADVSVDQIDRLRQHNDRAIAAALQKVYGAVARPTSDQKEREVSRLKALLAGDERGDAKKGLELFSSKCGVCHRLLGEGGTVGPDLTQYDRRDLNFLLVSIVDPSAAVREEFTNFRIDTKDDQTLIGLIAARGADSITVVDTTGQRTVVAKDQIADERALELSIMPEGLLEGLGEGALRDLFAYLRAEKAPGR